MKIKIIVALLVAITTLALASAASAWPPPGNTGNTTPFPLVSEGVRFLCVYSYHESTGIAVYVCATEEDPHLMWVCKRKPDGTYNCEPRDPNMLSGEGLALSLRLAEVTGDIPRPPSPHAALSVDPAIEYQFVLGTTSDPCVLNGAVLVRKEALPVVLRVSWGDRTSSLYAIPAGVGTYRVELSHSYSSPIGHYKVWAAKPHTSHGQGFIFDHAADSRLFRGRNPIDQLPDTP